MHATSVFEILNKSKLGQINAADGIPSIGVIFFQLADLRAHVERGDITGAEAIRDKALAIDRSLEAWRRATPSMQAYDIIDAIGAESDNLFRSKRHIYADPWVTDSWNYLRMLRILAHQIIVYECHDLPDVQKYSSIYVIQSLSVDMCVSVASSLRV